MVKTKQANMSRQTNRRNVNVSFENMRTSSRVKYAGSVLLQPTLAVGANVLGLNPSVFGLTSTLALLFNEFRFTSMAIRAAPNTFAFAVSVSPGFLTSPAPTIATAMETTNSMFVPSSTAEQTAHVLFVSRKTLINESPNKWYKAFDTADSDAWDSSQGILNITTATAGTVNLEVKYQIEFASTGTDNTGLSKNNPSFLPLQRISFIKRMGWDSLPVIDLILPSNPFPPNVNLDDEWRRVKKEGKKIFPVSPEKILLRLENLEV